MTILLELVLFHIAMLTLYAIGLPMAFVVDIPLGRLMYISSCSGACTNAIESKN